MLGVGRFKVNGPHHDVSVPEDKRGLLEFEHSDRMLKDDGDERRA
jgi:hypothetical protein